MILRKWILIVAGTLTACGLLCYRQVFASDSTSAKIEHSDEPAIRGTAFRGTSIGARDDAIAVAAFEAMVKVLHHPRCMNCHSHGDFPRQGDDSHPHRMNVRRGPDGQGIAGMRCATCHQDHNLAGRHMPPGAPGWHLPPPSTPMIWEGLSDAQLCELLKDPRQNGNRSVEEIVEHMSTPLVLWGWNPGEGRTPIPMEESKFLALVKEWASKGAACPAGTPTR